LISAKRKMSFCNEDTAFVREGDFVVRTDIDDPYHQEQVTVVGIIPTYRRKVLLEVDDGYHHLNWPIEHVACTNINPAGASLLFEGKRVFYHAVDFN
jgi:hypothetical protein